MRPTERDRLERKMLRLALKAAREALQAFPSNALKSLPAGQGERKLTLWAHGPRATAICELTAILGDVPIEEIEPRKPLPYRPDANPARVRDRLNEMKRQLGLPVLKY
jgi:hypothetical protein